MSSVVRGQSQATFCATLVDELRRGGVRDAVICPGSRSTPLALAAVAGGLRILVRLDERSAGFVALGLARSSGRPVLVVVTSGTAAAELLPAVVEASLDRVPMVLVTADRPADLQRIGAPQTIQQADLFGQHATFSLDPGSIESWPASSWRSLASRLVLEARGSLGLPGPVHLNLALAEPLLAEPGELPDGRGADRPWSEVSPRAPSMRKPAELLRRARGVIVAGHGAGSPESLLAAAASLGYVVLADPRSGIRLNSHLVVAAADGILRSEVAAAALRPDVVVLAGGPPASKILADWVASAVREGASQLVIGIDGPARHSARTAASFIIADPEQIWAQLVDEHELLPSTAWQQLWRRCDDAVASLYDTSLDGEFSEPGVARQLGELLAGRAQLVCSSSMPIRDLEWYLPRTDAPIRVFANRGANGIDGVVSTAIGAALGSNLPTVALVGDLAFLHDVSALVDGLDAPASLCVIVLDNDGGGIFSFLPQHDQLKPELFEQLFGTPRRTDPAAVARGFGHRCREVTSLAELDGAVAELVGAAGLSIICCRLRSRDENLARHLELYELSAEAAERACS